MITITINAQNGSEARQMLADLMGQGSGPVLAPRHNGPVAEPAPAKAESQPEPAEEPKRRGRKPKDGDAQAQPTAAETETAPAVESEPTGTPVEIAEPVKAASVEDVRTSMQAIIKKYEGDEGPKQVFALLSEFGVKKASELSDDQRAMFVAKANDKLAA